MDGRRSEPGASHDIAHDAEDLIRSLAGVLHAHVQVGRRGIDAIHVTATDATAARSMAANVRSALLAGLAAPVTATSIHVRIRSDDEARASSPRRSPVPASPDRQGAAGPAAAEPADSLHRVWLVEPRPEGRPSRFRDLDPDTVFPPPPPAPEAPTRGGGATADTGSTPLERPRLVAIDVERPGGGKVVCRVSIASGTSVHRAEAVAVDLPGAAAHAAAQAAVRALVEAGLDGLELIGLREVEIAGREYVLVALRQNDTSRRHRSGSAPIVGSPERSAAEAAVAAAADMT